MERPLQNIPHPVDRLQAAPVWLEWPSSRTLEQNKTLNSGFETGSETLILVTATCTVCPPVTKQAGEQWLNFKNRSEVLSKVK